MASSILLASLGSEYKAYKLALLTAEVTGVNTQGARHAGFFSNALFLSFSLFIKMHRLEATDKRANKAVGNWWMDPCLEGTQRASGHVSEDDI